MSTHKILAGSIMALFALIAVSMLAVFIANNYPLNPQILDIDLPLRIQEKEAKADNFITYETTFTQYKTLNAIVITYLIPSNSQEEHIELTRTRTVIPETHNLHVRNNVFIPPGTLAGEYTIHIHVVYQWNRFRTIEKHLESDTFFVLAQDGTIQTPTETGTFRNAEETPEAQKAPTPAVIEVQGKADIEVVVSSPSPHPTGQPDAERTPQPTQTPQPTPTPTPSPSPTPLVPLCNLLPFC